MTIQTQNHINVFIHTLHLSSLKLSVENPIKNLELFKLQLNEYPERALLLADSEDYIVLNHFPDKHYFDYLMDIGIGTSKILVPAIQGESLSDRLLKDEQLINFLQHLSETKGKVILHPYLSTQKEAKIAQKINATVNGSPPDLIAKINNKIYLPSLLHQLALPFVEYEITSSVAVIETAKKLRTQYEKIVIIGNYTYGGLAVCPITNDETLNVFEFEINKCNSQEQFLVAKMYETLCSPNIQYQINSNFIREIGVTDQILDDKLKHHGNIYPSSTAQLEIIREYSYRISQALQSQGYKGLLGIDFIETTDRKIFAVDINGRVNASSFGLNVLYKLFPESYPQKHLRILTHVNLGKKVTFFELKNLLGTENIFDKQKREGILPYNIGFLQWGKFSAIIIANTQQEADRLQSILNLE